MSEYKRTALVLGAGGFIGSHMVKRLRSEGYWVRGVDLKYPEFSETEAHEFIQGDLRNVDFVRRVIQFKGYQGNFFNEVPYRLVEPFDDYQSVRNFMKEVTLISLELNHTTNKINISQVTLNKFVCFSFRKFWIL